MQEAQQEHQEEYLSPDVDENQEEQHENEEEAQRILQGLIIHTAGNGENNLDQVSRNTGSDLHLQQNTAPEELDRQRSSREDLVGELGEAAPKCDAG